MEHLLIPSRPRHAPLAVPYLCTEPYDGQPWTAFIVRHKIEDVEVPGSWRMRYGVLQNWLYVGPLTGFLGNEQVAKGNFIRKSKETKGLILDTSSLTNCLREWTAGIQHTFYNAPDAEQAELTMQIEGQLELWLSMYRAIDCAGDELGQTIIYSIAVLHESICNAWSNVRAAFSYQNLVSRGDLRVTSENQFPWRRMRTDGWCPRELAALKSLPPSLQYYVSLLDQPGPGVQHQQCSSSACVAYRNTQPSHVKDGCTCPMINADTQIMSGILNSGSYPLIRMERGAKGQPPTVKIVPYRPLTKFVALSHVWSDGLGNPVSNSLSVCQLQRLTDLAEKVYAAKSMLDGVKDEMKDSLLDYVHQANGFVNNDDAKVYLWVDTICCPMQSQHPEEHALAINAMSRTYSEADKVIVLDKYIQAFPPTSKRLFRSAKTEKASELERMVRIRCSRWTQRMWTLQEGALAKELFFVFADGLFEFESLMFSIRQQGVLTGAVLATEMRRFHSSIRCVKVPEIFDDMVRAFDAIGTQEMMQLANSLAQQSLSPSNNAAADIILQTQNMVTQGRQRAKEEREAITPEMAYLNKFARICDAVATRSVTNAGDEAICLAILLDLDVAAVAAMPEAKRMEKFWTLQPHYSRSLACFRGPKLADSELEWAPASLINQPSGSDMTVAMAAFADRTAIARHGRIVVPFQGAIGERLEAPLPSNFVLKDSETGKSWLVSRREGSENNDNAWPHRGMNLKPAVIIVDDRNPRTSGPVPIKCMLALVYSELKTVTHVVLGPVAEMQELPPGMDPLEVLGVPKGGPVVQDGMTMFVECTFFPGERHWGIQGHTEWRQGVPRIVISQWLRKAIAGVVE